MIRPSLFSIAITIALACTPFTLMHAAAPTAIPDITLTTLNGSLLRMADLKGNVVLLDFWASWCIPCRKSFPEVDALHRELKPRGLQVVAVNVDEQQKNADAFLAKYPHTMTVALDPKGNAAQAFDLRAMPSTLIVDRAGRIRYTHQGYSEKTIAQFRSEVLQLLEEKE